MRNLLLVLSVVALTFTSCDKGDDDVIAQVTCRCQAETDVSGYSVYIEKACDLVTESDLQAVLNYAGAQGVKYVYTDTAIDICN